MSQRDAIASRQRSEDNMNDAYIAEYVVARSSATVSRSLLRIATSRREIAAARRRRWHTICGACASDAEAPSAHLRARVRLLVNPNEIPRIFSGYCMETKPCDICSRQLLVGDIEYEVGFSTLTFRLDADCFALWQQEMLRTSKQPTR
jgi:hypothetical protein